MAGSINHIVAETGSFRMDLIENMGDAHEALEECFDLIALLLDGDRAKMRAACKHLGIVVPEAVPVVGSRHDD